MILTGLIHPEASAELIEAAKWYEHQQLGLGNDFLESAGHAVEFVGEWPGLAPAFPGWDRKPVVRMASVARFPYRVLYYCTDSEVVVVAFAHNRRRPGYWTHRL